MQPLYITNPTLLTSIQWREVAKEPITALCIRHIIREMVALDWEIVPEKPDEQEEQVKYFTRVLQEADDGDGWDTWLTRMVLDALELPIAGNAEMSPDDVSGLLGGLYHIDGATLFPTYDTAIPFVQINPYNGLDRVYFERGEMFRLLLQPRPDLVRKMYQTAPLESAFPSIEALSRIYLYYMKQLGDTPMVGILDLMDFSSDEVDDWALNFKEMLNGIDPLKIPILYDHVKPAKFIPFSRSPQDLNIIETFKRYAEVVAAAFGLSIGDLRLFEHERTLAGVEASQRVTNRAGIGFYAQAIEDNVNRQILRDYESKMKFKFKQGATGEDLQEANLSMARATVIMTLTGNAPVLKPEDAQKVMQAWKMLPIEDLTGLPAAPGLAGLEGLGGGFPADNLSSIDQDTEAVGELATEETKPSALDTIDQVAAELGVKSVVKALLGDNLPQQLAKRRSITTGQFERLLAASFRQVGRSVTVDKIESLLNRALTGTEKSLVGVDSEDELMIEAVLKANETAAQKLDDILAQEDWWQMPDIVGELSGVLKQAYEEGAFQSAYHLQQQGYAQGATNQQTPPGFDFVLTNERVLFLIENYGAELVQNVDQGTKYFLRQKILSGAKQGESARDIAADIAQDLFKLKPSEAAKLSDTRIRSIVNTELNWADSRAMFDMMVATGLKTKGWITRGDSDVCDLCRGNEDLGFVELDYEYGTVFGDETTLHPPAHPSTCHCYLQSNPKELSSFFESGVGFWNGGDEPALEQAVEDETARIISENQAAQKSFGRPGLDKNSKTWQMLEKAGAVHMDILGVYRNVNNGKMFLDVGDWVSDATNDAIKQVFGDDVETDCEVGGPPDDSGNWQLIEPELKHLPNQHDQSTHNPHHGVVAYHGTKAKNVGSILKNGLVHGKYDKWVYASLSKVSAKKYGRDRDNEDNKSTRYAVVRFELPKGAMWNYSTAYDMRRYPKAGLKNAIGSDESISPKYITSIEVYDRRTDKLIKTVIPKWMKPSKSDIMEDLYIPVALEEDDENYDDLENIGLEEKSLPYSLWGYPDLPGKKARFDNEGDAQHWLITFGLVPVISDASFDVKGAGFREAGVIWHRDGYVEASVLPVDDLPEDDIVSGLATIFGGRGLKSTNVVKSEQGVMIALEVPTEIAALLGEQPKTPHITVAYLGQVYAVDEEAIRRALLDVTQSTIPFNVQLTGKIMTMGSGEVDAAEVKLTDDLKRTRDDLMAALHRHGYTADPTWGEFKPHVTIGDAGTAEGLNEAAMNANWFATGLSLYVGGERTFWPFRGAPVGDDGYYKHLFGKHDQRAHGTLKIGLTVFHGTASDVVAEMRKGGLKPSARGGGDAWARKFGWNAAECEVGYRSASVFFSTDKGIASLYAQRASDMYEGTSPVLIKIRIPSNRIGDVLTDEKDMKGLRLEGNILPDWIVGVESIKSNVAQVGDVYVVVLVDDREEKTLVVDTWLEKVPDHYRFEFQQFVKSRSKEDDLVNVSDEDMKSYYDDFMHSVFAFGFEYYKGADEYPPLMRSVVKSESGWEMKDAPSMLRAYLLGGSPDVKGAVEWLWQKGYQAVPKLPEGTGDDDMNSADMVALLKAMQESNAAILRSFAEAMVAKSQTPAMPVMFNVQLPDKVDLTGSSFIIKQDASPPPDMQPVADAITQLGETVRPQPVDLRPVAYAIEKAMSKPDVSPIVVNQAPDMSAVADAIKGVGDQLAKQPAPQVHVTLPAQLPAKIVNEIKVPPAQVIIQPPSRKGKTRLSVIKDKDGNIVGIEKDDNS